MFVFIYIELSGKVMGTHHHTRTRTRIGDIRRLFKKFLVTNFSQYKRNHQTFRKKETFITVALTDMNRLKIEIVTALRVQNIRNYRKSTKKIAICGDVTENRYCKKKHDYT